MRKPVLLSRATFLSAQAIGFGYALRWQGGEEHSIIFDRMSASSQNLFFELVATLLSDAALRQPMVSMPMVSVATASAPVRRCMIMGRRANDWRRCVDLWPGHALALRDGRRRSPEQQRSDQHEGHRHDCGVETEVDAIHKAFPRSARRAYCPLPGYPTTAAVGLLLAGAFIGTKEPMDPATAIHRV